MCSAIDKLDKEPWDVVRREMVDKKGLTGDVADKLQVFAFELIYATIEMHAHAATSTSVGAKILQVFVDPKYPGGFQAGSPSAVIPQLRAHAGMQAHAAARDAIEELSLMASYLEAFGTVGSVHIDLSLARGLDYYTGVIYEAVLVDGETKVLQPPALVDKRKSV